MAICGGTFGCSPIRTAARNGWTRSRASPERVQGPSRGTPLPGTHQRPVRVPAAPDSARRVAEQVLVVAVATVFPCASFTNGAGNIGLGPFTPSRN